MIIFNLKIYIFANLFLKTLSARYFIIIDGIREASDWEKIRAHFLIIILIVEY